MILARENGCFVPIVIKIVITKSYLTDMKPFRGWAENHIINIDNLSDGWRLLPREREWYFLIFV